MRYDDEVRDVLDATRGSEIWPPPSFPIDVSTTYTLKCLSDGRHATSDSETRCDGWVAPLNYSCRECRCACHEIVPRTSYTQALQRVRERVDTLTANTRRFRDRETDSGHTSTEVPL